MCATEYDREDWRDGATHDLRIDDDCLFYFDHRFGWEGVKVNFCPNCGRPLTEDAGLEPEDIDALLKREQGLAETLVNISCGYAVSYARLAELAQAEKDGRLVVLPCKVGDELWTVVTKRAKIYTPEFSFVKRSSLTWNNMRRVLQNFGKTVFLTREESEAALKKREADDETD